MLQNVRYALVDGIAPGALRVSKEGILLSSPIPSHSRLDFIYYSKVLKFIRTNTF